MKALQYIVVMTLGWAFGLFMFGLVARITWEMLRLGWSVL